MLPKHVAIIMDGNGRWARHHGLPRLEGHRRGAQAVRSTVRAAREIGIRALTLYAFSSENWGRPLDEVQGLMLLLRDYVVEEHDEIMNNGIRLVTIGNTSRLPEFVRLPLLDLIEESSWNSDMTLCLALSYGGRDAIVDSFRVVARKVTQGDLRGDEIDPAVLADTFQTRDLPPVDLLVRTSGERRVSNFLMWEAAEAEFYVTSTLWPDFTRAELLAALTAYRRTDGS